MKREELDEDGIDAACLALHKAGIIHLGELKPSSYRVDALFAIRAYLQAINRGEERE